MKDTTVAVTKMVLCYFNKDGEQLGCTGFLDFNTKTISQAATPIKVDPSTSSLNTSNCTHVNYATHIHILENLALKII